MDYVWRGGVSSSHTQAPPNAADSSWYSLRYHDLQRNEYLRYFRGHTARVTGLTMSPKTDMFMSCGLVSDCQGRKVQRVVYWPSANHVITSTAEHTRPTSTLHPHLNDVGARRLAGQDDAAVGPAHLHLSRHSDGTICAMRKL
jgi:WD40 repeat protein